MLLTKCSVLCGAILVGVTGATAAELTITNNKPVFHIDTSPQRVQQTWVTQRLDPQLVERPIADIISTRLGIGEGKVEFFRYRLENAPSNATVLDGVVDGGGIKLKITW